MTLLDSHPKILCSGEQFNPHAVVGRRGKREESFETVVEARDAKPADFMNSFFENAPERMDAVGFKFMLGHNIEAFRALEADPDISLIYVWRENRLAQVASFIKAAQSKRWAQQKVDDHVDKKIKASPRQVSQKWHENAMMDHMFESWLKTAPHRSMTVEYRSLFAPGFEEKLCEFLGVVPNPRMQSPLVKQGKNTISERFEDPKAISYYFRSVGRQQWLEDEL